MDPADTDTKEPEVDNFDDAFAQFAKPDAGAPAAEEEPADDDAPAGDSGDAAGGDDSTAADGDAGDDDSAGGDTDAAAGGDSEGDDKPAAPAKDRTDELIETLTAALNRKEEPAPQEKQAQEPAEEALYTEEEQEFLKTYDTDWSDVTRGESLKRRAEYRQIISHVFAEVQKALSPIQETVETLATRTHLMDIESSVPDYEELRDGVIAWVEEQPAYLQQGMKAVIQSGTAEEVADLIGRYREASGVKPKAQSAPTKQADLPEPTKKAVEALAPVSTKRTAIPQQDDPNDFDAAFKLYAGKNG